MRRFLLTVAGAAMTLASTACSDSTGIGSNVAGSYELRTVNGQSLPVNDPVGSGTVEAGLLEIENDGVFVESIQFRSPGSPLSQVDERFGTWDRSGNELRFDYDDGAVAFGDRTSESRIMLEDDSGNTWEYRRF